MVIGVIPARGGSKRVPRKNLCVVGGKTLLRWAIESAWSASSIDTIVVSTENREIEKAAYDALFELVGPNPVTGTIKTVNVIRRPLELAQDSTPMVAVFQHVLEATSYPDMLVCLQPTTPFRTGALIDEVIHTMGEADSALTVYDGKPTGEVYVTRRHLLLADRMLGGRCVDYERSGPAINIDGEYDVVRAERWVTAPINVPAVLSWPVRG